ncbi:MAG: NAD-dependent epimerase, partial [Burkholderiaceae bacterium]
MHMIVTGGSGFLGQQCIASLLKADSLELAPEASTPIRSITAFDVAVGSLQHPKLHYVVGDIA